MAKLDGSRVQSHPEISMNPQQPDAVAIVALIHHEAQHPRFPGLGGRKLELNFPSLIAGKDEVIHGYRDRKYQSILDSSDKIKVLPGQAHFLDPHTVELDGHRLVGEQVLVATGTRAAVPAVPGLEDVRYLTSDLLTSDEPLELFQQPGSIIVIGAGDAAPQRGPMFHPL